MPKTGCVQEHRDAATGRFMAGNRSGGRRPMPKDLVEMLRADTEAACKLLGETIRNPEAKLELRIKCCEIVLDRVYGKPRQSVDLEQQEGAACGVIIMPQVLDG